MSIFCNPQALFKKISIILALFGKKQALLLAFNAFFTSTFGKSLQTPTHGLASTLRMRTAISPRQWRFGLIRPHQHGIAVGQQIII